MLNIFVETVILYHSDVWGKKETELWNFELWKDRNFESAKMHWID